MHNEKIERIAKVPIIKIRFQLNKDAFCFLLLLIPRQRQQIAVNKRIIVTN